MGTFLEDEDREGSLFMVGPPSLPLPLLSSLHFCPTPTPTGTSVLTAHPAAAPTHRPGGVTQLQARLAPWCPLTGEGHQWDSAGRVEPSPSPPARPADCSLGLLLGWPLCSGPKSPLTPLGSPPFDGQ